MSHGPMRDNRTPERAARDYAEHIGLRIIRRGAELALYERDNDPAYLRATGGEGRRLKRLIGRYHTWTAVDRAITRWLDRTLAEMTRRPA
jgi:hypothetical protein